MDETYTYRISTLVLLTIIGGACLFIPNVSARKLPHANRRDARQIPKSRSRELQARKTFWITWDTQGFTGGNAKFDRSGLDKPVIPTGQVLMIDEVSGRCIAPAGQKVYFEIDVWSNALYHRKYYFSTQPLGAGFEDSNNEPLLLHHLTSIPIYKNDNNVFVTAYRNSGAATVPVCHLVVSGYYALVN